MPAPGAGVWPVWPVWPGSPSWRDSEPPEPKCPIISNLNQLTLYLVTVLISRRGPWSHLPQLASINVAPAPVGWSLIVSIDWISEPEPGDCDHYDEPRPPPMFPPLAPQCHQAPMLWEMRAPRSLINFSHDSMSESEYVCMCKCLIFAHATEQYLADILLTIDQLFPGVTCNVVTRQHVLWWGESQIISQIISRITPALDCTSIKGTIEAGVNIFPSIYFPNDNIKICMYGYGW